MLIFLFINNPEAQVKIVGWSEFDENCLRQNSNLIDCPGVSKKEGYRLEIEPRSCSKPEESSPSGTSGTDSPGAGIEEVIFPNNQQPNLGKMTSMEEVVYTVQ